MGCSTSKERGSVLGRGSTQSPPVAPEPVEVEDHKPEALMSAATSTKASSFHTHSTEASSFYGFKGGGRSLASLGSTTAESMPQSEGGSELGSVSLFSSSSKRSTGFGADRLSEHSDEEEIDEDFEDDDVEPTTRSESRDTPGAKRPDLDPIKAEMSPSSRTQSKADTSASAIRYASQTLQQLVSARVLRLLSASILSKGLHVSEVWRGESFFSKRDIFGVSVCLFRFVSFTLFFH